MEFSEQDGNLLTYDDFSSSTTFTDGVDNVKLTNDTRFGIWLKDDYENKD